MDFKLGSELLLYLLFLFDRDIFVSYSHISKRGPPRCLLLIELCKIILPDSPVRANAGYEPYFLVFTESRLVSSDD
jgi:hypothetical protein